MQRQITRFSIHQSSKILAILLFITMAIPLLPAGIYMMFAMGMEEGNQGFFFLAVPFIYLIGGYLFYAVFFFMYNLVARFFGGIEFTSGEVEK